MKLSRLSKGASHSSEIEPKTPNCWNIVTIWLPAMATSKIDLVLEAGLEVSMTR